MRGAPFAKNMTEPSIAVYCNATVRDMILGDTGREIRPEIASTVKIKTLHPFDDVTSDGMRIIALPARHTKGEECLVYYVERGGVGALFLNDTGRLDGQVYSRLKAMGASVKFAALDCTYGTGSGTSGRHMGLGDVAEQVGLIRDAGLFARDPIIYATHFSHNTDLDFDGMREKAAELGILVAYDGCTVDVNA